MSLEEAFLKDILANPDTDTARLVYADWLDENGDESARARAELIRAQCALERLPPGDPQRGELERLARGLLEKHGKAWTAPLRKARLGSKWLFRRGFVEELTLSAARFVNVAEKLFALAPIRVVHFPEASNEVSGLAACPYLARLTTVDLDAMCRCGSCPIHDELKKLFVSPYIGNVTTLVLSFNRMDARVLRHLVDSPHLSGLEVLDLFANRLETAGVRILAAALTAGLRSLSLRENGIGPVGARVLAGSPHLARLASLDLADNNIGDPGARALAGSSALAGLKELDVRDNGIGESGAAALRVRFGKRVRV